MKCALAVLLAVFLGSILLIAQSANSQSGASGGGLFRIGGPDGQSAQSLATGQASPTACPVSMHLQHRSDGNLVRTQSTHPKGTGQLLHLTLTGPDSKQITKATLTVYGISPKGLLQYAAKGDASSEMTQTSTVPFVASGDGGYSADLWVPGMTAVQLIELKSIQYSDGSTWKLADRQTCQAKPDLFMLISNR